MKYWHHEGTKTWGIMRSGSTAGLEEGGRRSLLGTGTKTRGSCSLLGIGAWRGMRGGWAGVGAGIAEAGTGRGGKGEYV